METNIKDKEFVKKSRLWAKEKWPTGTEIFDSARSGSYKIKKTSVFAIFEFEYTEEFQPENDEDIWLEVLVRDPGKYTDFWCVSNSLTLTKGDVK